jgi:hypothetical protein
VTIRAIAPTNLQTGYNIGYTTFPTGTYEWLNSSLGSVTDGSDATKCVLEGDWVTGSTSGTDVMRVGNLTVDFPAVTDGFIPNALVVQLRARCNPDYVASAPAPDPEGITIFFTYAYADGSPYYDQWSHSGSGGDVNARTVLNLASGSLATATTWAFYYEPNADPADPTDGNWNTFDEFSNEYYALTTTGLRLTIHVEPALPTYPMRNFLDIFEIKLLVSGTGGLPPNTGQLHVNLSTTVDAPDWVSVCGGASGAVDMGGEVTITTPLGPNWSGPIPAVVGGTAVWNDGTDSSYADIFCDGTSGSAGAQIVIPAIPSIPVGAEIFSATISIRGKDVGGAGYGVYAYLIDLMGDNISWWSTNIDSELVIFGSSFETVTLTYPPYGYGVDPAEFATHQEYLDYLKSCRVGLADALRGGSKLFIYAAMIDTGTGGQVNLNQVSEVGFSFFGGGLGHFDISTVANSPSWNQIHLGFTYANISTTSTPDWWTCCSHGASVVPASPIVLTINWTNGAGTTKFGTGTDSEVVQDSSTLTGWTIDSSANSGELGGYFSGGPGSSVTSGTVFTLHVTADWASVYSVTMDWTVYANDSSNVQYSMSGSYAVTGSYSTQDIVLSSALSASYDPVSFADSLVAGAVEVYLSGDNPSNVYEITLTAT